MLGSLVQHVLTNKSAIGAGELLNTCFKVSRLFRYCSCVKGVILGFGCATLALADMGLVIFLCPVAPFVCRCLSDGLGLCRLTYCASECLYTFFIVCRLLCYNACIPSAISGFLLSARTFTVVLAGNSSQRLPFTKGMLGSLVQHVLTNKSAIGAGKLLNTCFKVCGFFSHNTVVISTILGLICVTTASSCMSTVAVRRPIRPLMFSLGEIFGFCMLAGLAGVSFHALFSARGLGGYNAVIPLMRQGFELIAVVIQAVALVVFIPIRRPV